MPPSGFQEIEILHQISKLTSNFNKDTTPLKLQTELLKNLFSLFKPENEVIFTTLQCFAQTSSKKLKRMENIPSIFNNNTTKTEHLPTRLKEILLFLSGSLLLSPHGNEPSAEILNIFKDKFIIETIKVKNTLTSQIHYNHKFNTLSICIPDLYCPEISQKYFPFIDAKLANLQTSFIGNDGFFVDGEIIESILPKIMTSPDLKKYLCFIHSYFRKDEVKKFVHTLAASLKNIESEVKLPLSNERVIQFCQTVVLHNLLKPSNYSYQIIVTKKDKVNNPFYHGTYLFNSNKAFPLNKLNLFHIGLNLSLSAINESVLIENKKDPYKKPLNKSCSKTTLFYGMIGRSSEMLSVYEKIRKVARFDTDILILGESGTGKDLVAQAIHRLSEQRDGPFIAISLSDRPDTLIESELFGHEQGAFTGASNQKRGYLERAQNGTLFLDEISHIPSNVQAKLLRVFQSRSFERVGGSTLVNTNIRIICATSEDLRNKEIRENLEFIDPLYYRLEQFVITMPPLRKRKSDIPLLINFYLNKMNNGKDVSISKESIAFLLSLDWPGNIRQLIAALKRAYIDAYDDGVIQPHHFEIETSTKGSTIESLNLNLKTVLDFLRRNNFVINQTFIDLNQNAFKMSRKTLIRYVRELCIWFLAHDNWDLRMAIKNMAGQKEFERNTAIRYRNYFIGDKRSLGIINILTNNYPQLELERALNDLVHNEFNNYLYQLKNNLERKEVTKQTWEYILSQYV